MIRKLQYKLLYDKQTIQRLLYARRPEGWYGWLGLKSGTIWKLPYYNLFIIYFFFSDKFAYLISYAESKARLPSAPNVVIWGFFLPEQKKPHHPRDLVIWVFCPCKKKAVSPTWPIITSFALHKSDMCLKAMLVSHMQINIFSSKCLINVHAIYIYIIPYNTLTRKYVHFGYVILAWLSSTYHSCAAQKVR